MRMRIETGSHSIAVKEQLEREGWRVDQSRDGKMTATHTGIVDEPDARQHLQEMGLLTSSKVRIEFVVMTERDL